MADRRPRNQRPRHRGGKNRLAKLAAARRQNEHISSLQQALAPDLAAMEGVDRLDVVDRIRAQATTLASERLSGDVTEVVEATLDEIFGLGPLEPVLRDPTVRVLRVEGADLFADDEPVRGFRDEAHARAVVERILRAAGAVWGDQPVEATMMDGSVVRAELHGDAPKVEIRRPSRDG